MALPFISVESATVTLGVTVISDTWTVAPEIGFPVLSITLINNAPVVLAVSATLADT